jgi:S-ribosylhomocysteine lyase
LLRFPFRFIRELIFFLYYYVTLWLFSLTVPQNYIKVCFRKNKGDFIYGKNCKLYNRPYQIRPGVYVSRKDTVGAEVITTFDLRMTSPNDEPVMNTAEMHTIEHLAATFLRNHAVYGSKTIYFGPMGCRTGFYLLLAGDYESKDIVGLMIEMFEFIRDFKGDVPGASPKDCGNYLDMNLGMANYLANRYLENTLYHIDEKHLVYPE